MKNGIEEYQEQIKFLTALLAKENDRSPENNPAYWVKVAENPDLRALFFETIEEWD